jgi:ribonuclease E
MISPDFKIERFKTATRRVAAVAPITSMDAALMDEIEEEALTEDAEVETPIPSMATISPGRSAAAAGAVADAATKATRRRMPTRRGRGRGRLRDRHRGRDRRGWRRGTAQEEAPWAPWRTRKPEQVIAR